MDAGFGPVPGLHLNSKGYPTDFPEPSRGWSRPRASATASVFVGRAISSGWQGRPDFSANGRPIRGRSRSGKIGRSDKRWCAEVFLLIGE